EVSKTMACFYRLEGNCMLTQPLNGSLITAHFCIGAKRDQRQPQEGDVPEAAGPAGSHDSYGQRPNYTRPVRFIRRPHSAEPLILWGECWRLLVTALVHAGEAIVPGQAIVVEERPDEAEAAGCDRKNEREDAAAHGFAAGVVVGEGAEADAGVAHAGSR